ncbi:Sec-independent protein translocase TatA [Sphingomonas sp. MMS24-JH45]
MGSFSLPHILDLAVVAILLLGGGRFSSMMGDVAKGVKNFKKGMAEEDEDDRPARAKPRIEAQSAARPASETVVDRDAAPVDRVREDR